MKRGFTIIDVLLTLAIVTLISAVGVYSLRGGGPKAGLRNASRQLVIDLRFSSEQAATQQVNYAVRLRSAEYDIVRLATPEVLLVTKSFPFGVTLESTTLPASEAQFNVLGGAVNSGTVTLQNRAGSTMVIDVRPSGYARIQ